MRAAGCGRRLNSGHDQSVGPAATGLAYRAAGPLLRADRQRQQLTRRPPAQSKISPAMFAIQGGLPRCRHRAPPQEVSGARLPSATHRRRRYDRIKPSKVATRLQSWLAARRSIPVTNLVARVEVILHVGQLGAPVVAMVTSTPNGVSTITASSLSSRSLAGHAKSLRRRCVILRPGAIGYGQVRGVSASVNVGVSLKMAVATQHRSRILQCALRHGRQQRVAESTCRGSAREDRSHATRTIRHDARGR